MGRVGRACDASRRTGALQRDFCSDRAANQVTAAQQVGSLLGFVDKSEKPLLGRGDSYEALAAGN